MRVAGVSYSECSAGLSRLGRVPGWKLKLAPLACGECATTLQCRKLGMDSGRNVVSVIMTMTANGARLQQSKRRRR
jgi:hypothetical protein